MGKYPVFISCFFKNTITYLFLLHFLYYIYCLHTEIILFFNNIASCVYFCVPVCILLEALENLPIASEISSLQLLGKNITYKIPDPATYSQEVNCYKERPLLLQSRLARKAKRDDRKMKSYWRESSGGLQGW